ncbi:MAG TPA: hypothetical protein VG735_00575 [Caulobacterales bacterium]|nr:hypothetical protein [Caulobacterales bacterium]
MYKKHVTLGARLQYAFDRTMAAGPIALIGWLAAATLVVLLLAATFLSLTHIAPAGGQPFNFLEAFWQSLMRAMDPGDIDTDVGWPFRLTALAVTLWGVFVLSTLIGLLSAGVQAKLADLRKGRSVVLEIGHTVILNWSSSIFDIASEIFLDDPRATIVVMADKDKVEMEDAITAKLPAKARRIICRSGDPTDLTDLSIVNLHTANSIIIVSPEVENPDAHVIKSLLALVHDPHRSPSKYRIAAECRSARNAEIAQAIAGGEAQIVLADDLISRIIVHSSRQAGLSGVYSELLDFEGCEMYTMPQPALAGKSFGDALSLFDKCAVLGLCGVDGKVTLNPPMDTVIVQGDQTILLANDRRSIKLANIDKWTIQTAAIRDRERAARAAERTLILGWNHRGPTIVTELARYAAPGSSLTIAANGKNFVHDMAALAATPGNVVIVHQTLDIARHGALDALDMASFSHVIVLSYCDDMDAQAADTSTLITLLNLRHVAERNNLRFTLVSAMADIRNRELAEATRADDFVVSNKLVSLMLAQASKNEYFSAIFRDILDVEGSEIYMRPAEDYVALGESVNFYTIVEAARRRGEVAFGYCKRRAGASDKRHMGGVTLNPVKSEAGAYQAGDLIIVLAQS